MSLPGFQFRSISLPSRPHPLKSPKIEGQLRKLNSLPQTASLVTSEAVQLGLLRLSELCTSLEEINGTHSRAPQQSLEDSLENSIELIDSCSLIKETVVMIRENMQSLQSMLRRKSSVESSIQDGVSLYFCFRKKMHKAVSKSVKTLKNLEHKNPGSKNADGNFLKFLTGYATTIFNDVLVFLSGRGTKLQGNWSLVSRLMLAKPDASVNGVDNEVGRVDLAVRSLQRRIRDKSVRTFHVQMVQKELNSLENAMEGLEIGLERSFRSLVQIRVKLLNIITDHL